MGQWIDFLGKRVVVERLAVGGTNATIRSKLVYRGILISETERGIILNDRYNGRMFIATSEIVMIREWRE